MAEGGWPAIKLISLVGDGLADSKGAAPGDIQFASPEQLRDGTVDFRSEVYSLGSTLSYLLTGAFYSAEPKSLQTRRFAKPLRKLLRPMLRQDPQERPQDPVLIADALRSCLQTVERRQLLSQRFGIPFFAVRARGMPKPRRQPASAPRPVFAHMGQSGVASAEPPVEIPEPLEPPRSSLATWMLRGATALAILLGLGLFAAALMPGRALALFQGRHEIREVGVTQPAPVWEGKPLHLDKQKIPVATAATSLTPVPSAAAPVPAPSAAPANPSVAANNPGVSEPAPSQSTPPSVAQADTAGEPAPPAEGPQSLWEKAGNRPLNQRVVSRDAATTQPLEQPGESTEQSEPSESTPPVARAEEDRPALKINRSSVQTRSRAGSSNANRPVVRTGRTTARLTANGSVILRLPDGQIAVIPPTKVQYERHRTHPRRRVIPRTVYRGYEPGYPYYSPRD